METQFPPLGPIYDFVESNLLGQNIQSRAHEQLGAGRHGNRA
jgi:hypothetical protein